MCRVLYGDSLVFSLRPLYNPNPVLKFNGKPLFSLQPSICSVGKLNFRLFASYQLNAHVLYHITIYMLHYNRQHVSSSTLLIFRRTNCIITASGIVTLCKQPYSMPVESGLQSALNRHTVGPIPDAVIIQFVLLKMSKLLLETC